MRGSIPPSTPEPFDRAIEGVRAELKGDLAALRIELKGGIAQVNAGLACLETEVKTENRVIHARLDEQRQTVNALIPQRIAAAGRTDAAE